MKMISVIWFLSFLAFLVADVQKSASQEKAGSPSLTPQEIPVNSSVRGNSLNADPLRCYQCLPTNQTTDCDEINNLSTVKCPPNLPYCATTATSPDYTSSLKCSVRGQTPCTLIQKAKDTYEMTCTCAANLCNAPFNREFRNELLNFSSTSMPDNKTATLTEALINSSLFTKIAAANRYEAVTSTREVTTLTAKSANSLISIVKDVDAPRAEALKHEATVPPDDDEDESEGSGSFDDIKPQIPAAPAAPSSFLPANENKAIPVHINVLAIVTFLLILYTVA